MNTPELKMNVVDTTESMTTTDVMDRRALIADLKQRLEDHKVDIFSGVDNIDIVTLVEKANEKVLNTGLLKVNTKQVLPGDNEYKMYYTGRDGKQYQLDLAAGWEDDNDKNEHMDEFFYDVFEAVTYWLVDKKVSYLTNKEKDPSTSDADKQKVTQLLRDLQKDIRKAKQDMRNEMRIAIDVPFVASLRNQKNTIETQIDQDIRLLLDKATNFSGSYAELEQLEQALDRKIADITTMTGGNKAKFMRFIPDLERARAGLAGKYIKGVIAKIDANPSTPRPDILPVLATEIQQAIDLIDRELATLVGGPIPAGPVSLPNKVLQEQVNALLIQKQRLENSLSQVDLSKDDQEAARIVTMFTETLQSLRSGLSTLNASSLRSKKDTITQEKNRLQGHYSSLSGKKMSSSYATQMKELLDAYTLAEDELTMRIDLSTKRDELIRLKIDMETMMRSGARKKKISAQQELIIQKEIEITLLEDNLAGYGGVDTPEMRSLPDLPSEQTINDRLNNGYQVVPPAKRKEKGSSGPSLQTHSALQQAYQNSIPVSQQQSLVAQYSGNTLNRQGLTPIELEYMINYMQIAVNINNESRANQLNDLTNMNREFSNITIGTGADMRVMAEDINRLLADEKVRAKYTKKAFQSAFTWALLEAYNKQNILQIEYLMANNRGLPEMQQLPTFFSNQQIDVRGPPYELGAVALEWFGPGRKGSIKDMVGKKLYNKYLKNVSIVEPYLYSANLPGTNVSQKPSRGGNAVMMKNEHGTREIIGETMTNDTLLNLYLQGYESYDVSGGGQERKLTTDPKIAYNIVDRWFTEGMDLIGMTKAAYMKKGMNETEALNQANIVAEQLLIDAFTYDDDLIYHIRDEYHLQMDYYRAAFEKKQGTPVPDRSPHNIPLDQKHRMISRAAVRGFSRGFGHGQDTFGNIEQQLMRLYGGGRKVTDEFVNNSNHEVGTNITRLIDDHEKKPGYALSARSLEDFGSLDKMMDKIQTKGFFDGIVGDGITTALQQYLPWIRPEQAKMLGGTIGTVAKWATVIFLVKTLRTAVKNGDGFWGKVWRIGMIGTGAVLFGKDLLALGFGGKGGTIAEGVSHFLNKGKDYDKRGLSSPQMLAFTFGNQSLQELFGILEVKDGKFVVADNKMAGLFGGSGLAADQQEAMKAIMGGSREGMSRVINEGLTGSGITVDNYKQVLATSGTKSVRERINGSTRINQYETDLSDILGIGVGSPEFMQIKQHVQQLPEQEQQAFLERINQLKTFFPKWYTIKTYLHDHLMTHRPGLMGSGIDTPTISAGFANQQGLIDLTKDFLLATGSFAPGLGGFATTDQFLTTLHSTLFQNDPSVGSLLRADDPRTDIQTLLNEGPDDQTMTVDMNSPARASWFVNRKNPSTPQAAYTELLLSGVPNVSTEVFLGVETQSNALVFRLPKSSGGREQWTIDTVGGQPLSVDGFGMVQQPSGAAIFGLSLPGSSGTVSYETKYAPQLLRSSIHAAQQGNTEFSLSAQEFSDPSASERGKVTMKKTGKVR